MINDELNNKSCTDFFITVCKNFCLSSFRKIIHIQRLLVREKHLH